MDEYENVKDPQFKVSTFFEMTPDLLCIAGKDGFLKKVNAAVIEKLGYTRKNYLRALSLHLFNRKTGH